MGPTKTSAALTVGIRRQSQINDRWAFTLLEMLVVLSLITIVCGVVLVQFRGPYERALSSQSIFKLEQWLTKVRENAVRNRRDVGIRIDLAHALLTCTLAADKHISPLVSELHISDTIQMDRLRLANKEFDSGSVQFRIDASGRSPTVAIHLVPSKAPAKWLMVLGGSGQIIELSKEGIDHVFELLPQRLYGN